VLEHLLVELVDGQVLNAALGPGHLFDRGEGEEVPVLVADAAVAAQNLGTQRFVSSGRVLWQAEWTEWWVCIWKLTHLWTKGHPKVGRCQLRRRWRRSAAVPGLN
jgi:hypothetical protein